MLRSWATCTLKDYLQRGKQGRRATNDASIMMNSSVCPCVKAHTVSTIKDSTVGPRFRGNASKAVPHVTAKFLWSKKISGIFYKKKFQYKGLRYKGHFNIKVKVFVPKRAFSQQ